MAALKQFFERSLTRKIRIVEVRGERCKKMPKSLANRLQGKPGGVCAGRRMSPFDKLR